MLVCPDGASCESVALDKPALDSSRATEVYSAFGRGFGRSCHFSSQIERSCTQQVFAYSTHGRQTCPAFVTQRNIWF